MKVSLMNPTTQKVTTIKMGINWGLLIFFLVMLVTLFRVYGLLPWLVCFFIEHSPLNSARQRIIYLLKKGWSPAADTDKAMLVKTGFVVG